ncbi:uncharacterized protein LOC111446501 isoform X1 [Cucurbita moschata]|uniref:Uncharacterized protein LOC111446501 isoform X1 n=2 Tax=Cucurbita moschata TaxID=3662 RepID=A0A6J1FR55_CUCMO|nr:uncharacterized protein LOC111446501 isoform X1 [Cucurbita moschata]
MPVLPPIFALIPFVRQPKRGVSKFNAVLLILCKNCVLKTSNPKTQVPENGFIMKLGREAKGISSTDLLVCFPSRSRLALMPNPLCSPVRGSDSSKLRRSRRSYHHRRRKSAESPVVWAKAKTVGSEMSEPSSPKVTCAGQVKMRRKNRERWQSVMEEIERIHNRRKLRRRRRVNWVESLGFKKDIMQLLTCLRSLRFDFRCFRAFSEADFTTEEDEDEEEEEESESSRAAFSKWFMVLQENRMMNGCTVDDDAPVAPPKNALLLMRCRSAPAKSWVEETVKKKKKKSLKWLMEEENRERLGMEKGTEISGTSPYWLPRSRSWKV